MSATDSLPQTPKNVPGYIKAIAESDEAFALFMCAFVQAGVITFDQLEEWAREEIAADLSDFEDIAAAAWEEGQADEN